MSDDLRERFQLQAKSIAVPQEDFDGIIRSGRKRVWRRRIVSVTTAVAVIGASAAVLTQLGGGRDPSPVASGDRLTVLARIPLRSEPNSAPDFTRDLTSGFGYIWALHARDGTLQRIDPTTNEVDRVINLSENRGARGDYWDVEAAFGAIWVASPHGRVEGVTAIDPDSGDVRGTIDDVGRPLNLFVSKTPDALWVHSGSSGTGHEVLYRVDPETLEVTGSLGMGAECCLSGIAQANDYLWVSHSDTPNSPREDASDPLDAIFDLTNEIRQVDLKDGTLVDTIELAGDTYRPGDTVLGGLISAHGYLWVAHTDAGFVERVDPQSGDVEAVDVENMQPSTLTYFEGEVWAWDINGTTAVPIDPTTLAVGEVSDIEEVPGSGPIEGAGSLWAGDGEEDSVLRIGRPERGS